jgi:hypothetical protein
MAYATGSFTDLADLNSILKAFVSANGWTVSGDMVYRGTSFQYLDNPTNNQWLRIRACNSAAGLELETTGKRLYVPSGGTSKTYHLYVHTNPDMVFCIVNYNGTWYRMLCFGNIVKIHASAFPGAGNFVYDPTNGDSTAVTLARMDMSELFWTSQDGTPNVLGIQSSLGIPMNTGISGDIWGNSTTNPQINFVGQRIYWVTPNNFNAQAVLIPMALEKRLSSSPTFSMYLGNYEHIRLIRIDNYNPGDIVTVGGVDWKVFPWFRKDASQRNGNTNITAVENQHSGTMGYAIRHIV